MAGLELLALAPEWLQLLAVGAVGGLSFASFLGGLQLLTGIKRGSYYRLVVWKHLLEVAKLTTVLDFMSPDMAESELMLSSVAERIKRNIEQRNREILEKSFRLRFSVESEHNFDYSLFPENDISNTFSGNSDFDLEYINAKFAEVSLLASELKKENNVDQKLIKTETIISIISDVLRKYGSEFEGSLLKEVKGFLRFMEANRVLYKLKNLAKENLDLGSGNPLLTLRYGIDSFNLLTDFVQNYWDIQPQSVKEHYKSLAISLYGIDLEIRSRQGTSLYSNAKEFIRGFYLSIKDKQDLKHKYFDALKSFISSVNDATSKDFQVSKQTEESNTRDTREKYQKISNLYSLTELSEVQEFLDSHQEMLAILLEVPQKVEEYFSKSTLFLKMVYDPEISGWERLSIMIETEEKPAKAIRLLSSFRKNLRSDFPGVSFRSLDIGIITK